MPKIAEIDDTPNPNAVKFTLHEPLTWGVSHSYENAEQASGDALASSLFAIAHVSNVFYVDRWLTVTQDGGADWPALVRLIAVPLRAAPAAAALSAAAVFAARVSIDDMSEEDQARLDVISDLLDQRIRPSLQVTAATCMWSACPATTSASITRAPAAAVRARSPARWPRSRTWCAR